MTSVFPFVVWTNPVFWAWLGWIQCFPLWCEPVQAFGHGWDDFRVGMNSVTWTNSVFWAWLGWIQSFLLWCDQFSLLDMVGMHSVFPFCAVNKLSLLGMVAMHSVFPFVTWTHWDFWERLEWMLSFLLCDVNQLSLLGVVGLNWIFPFVMWNNSVFWAWLEWIHSFLLSLFLRCEILVVLFAVPVSKPGWGEFSFFCCNVNESCACC